MWNLDFFRDFYPEIYLNMSTLTVLALDYAVAIYPLFLTALSYILIELHGRNFRPVVIVWKPFRYVLTRVRKNWDSKTTIIDAFVTFFVLSYVKILCVSADLLIPVLATDLKTNNQTLVFYYDGTITYFGCDHLP